MIARTHARVRARQEMPRVALDLQTPSPALRTRTVGLVGPAVGPLPPRNVGLYPVSDAEIVVVLALASPTHGVFLFAAHARCPLTRSALEFGLCVGARRAITSLFFDSARHMAYYRGYMCGGVDEQEAEIECDIGHGYMD